MPNFISGIATSQHVRKLLSAELSETSAIAECLHLVAEDYVNISSKHLLTPVNQLGRLVVPSSSEHKAKCLQDLQVTGCIMHVGINENISNNIMYL